MPYCVGENIRGAILSRSNDLTFKGYGSVGVGRGYVMAKVNSESAKSLLDSQPVASGAIQTNNEVVTVFCGLAQMAGG